MGARLQFDIVLRGPGATPQEPLMTERTPSQTVGPFLHIGLAPADDTFRRRFAPVLAAPGLVGNHIRIEGRISDGDGTA